MNPDTRTQIDVLVDELFDNADEIKAGLDRLDEENAIVDSLLAARHAEGDGWHREPSCVWRA